MLLKWMERLLRVMCEPMTNEAGRMKARTQDAETQSQLWDIVENV